MSKAPDIFLSAYKSNENEKKAQEIWDNSGFANPDVCLSAGVADPNAQPFSMVLPPPNVTGSLHTGHALMLAIQDIMARHARMQGRPTLWIPGTDHAAIATQSKVEKLLEKEGVKKNDLGREEFLNRVNEYAMNSHDTIVIQTRATGASLDWSRECYTLDPVRSLAVRTAFKQMYDDGLIYRGSRIVNWDPKGQTTISDDEIVNEERTGVLYTFKYSHDFPIAIATTRPETKVGDVAVAVNPNDERYQQYIGNEYDCVFCGVPIHVRIIADDAAQAEFGTGALGVTPAHSQIDWEMAQRHNLPVVPVINEYAKMTVGDDRILNKKTTDARAVIVEWLRSEGLLISEETITQNIPTAERTGAVIEPLPKMQWFVDVNKPFILRHSELDGITAGDTVTLKQLMLQVVRNNQITILPDRFESVYFNWIENLRDWCISRQIWFGHRIPVWYNRQTSEIYCGIDAPDGDNWDQDPDTLDTWFSSGLWTFSTLGWPNTDSRELPMYHPTTVLETGHDIIFFWVARMVLMTTYLTGQIPFRTAYLHGMVRAADGKKMSKSMGNSATDPLDIIAQYGADALRMALIVGVGPGQDIKLSEDKIKAYGKFANKLWNITRYVLDNTPHDSLIAQNVYTADDQAQWDTLQQLIRDINPEMDGYKYYLVSEKLYHYIWHTFADVVIESTKSRIMDQSQGADGARSAQALLQHTLVTCLKLLHPFMPHVTETIWQQLPAPWRAADHEVLMVSKWPTN